MDEFKKILSAYKSVLDKEYNFEGIILNPVFLEDEIFWEFKNPNDLSVSEVRIKNFISDIFDDLSKYIGGEDTFIKYKNKLSQLDSYGRFPGGRVYLNKFDKNDIWNETDKITQIRFKQVVIDIEIVGLEFDNRYDEDFYMGFETIIKGASWNELKLQLKEEIVKAVSKVFYDDDFRDYEYDLFHKVNKIIFTNPLLFEDGYTYFTHDMIPLYKTGSKMELN